MSEYGWFMGWSGTAPGKDAEAAALHGRLMSFMADRLDDGTIESYEPVLLGRHRGALSGFLLVRGERAKLRALRGEPAFVELQRLAEADLSDYELVEAVLGDGVREMVELLQARMTSG